MLFAQAAKTKKWVSMTPLIDIVFLLLIFFMLTTNFIHQNSILLQVPNSTALKNSWQDAILVRPDKNGLVRINADKIKLSELDKKLPMILASSKTKRVVVQPYQNVELQTLVDVLDKVRDSGALAISLL